MPVEKRKLSSKEISQLQERAIPISSFAVIRTHSRSRYDGSSRQPKALLLVRPDEQDADLLAYSVDDPNDLIVSLQDAARKLECWFPS